MPEIRYLCTMIGEVPVVTTPAEIDITNADQLRAVLLDAAARGHATVVVNLTRPSSVIAAGWGSFPKGSPGPAR